ncbi:MAG: CD1247 N-terminal domain-containing protein [Peptococcia bacterium]|jgi:phage FluMu protein Com
MSDLKEKIAYLEGLAEGLALEKDSKEGKIFTAVIDVLREMAVAVEETESYVEALDEDLGDVEDILYGDDADFEECDEECSFPCCDGDYIEVACPNCHEVLHLDSCLLEDDDVTEITCPNCDELLHVNEDSNLQMINNAPESEKK